MTTHLEATFKGHGDLTYKHNYAYQLCVEQRWNGKLTITATHGYEFKPITGTFRSYQSLGLFLDAWQIIRVAANAVY